MDPEHYKAYKCDIFNYSEGGEMELTTYSYASYSQIPKKDLACLPETDQWLMTYVQWLKTYDLKIDIPFATA